MLDKNNFVELIERMVSKKEFEEIYRIIVEGNYSIEIVLNYFLWTDESTSPERDETMVAIIYNRNVYASRSNFREAFSPKPIQSKEQRVNDYFKIFKKIGLLFRLNFFKELESLLNEYKIQQEEEWKRSFSIRELMAYITFRINGIEIFDLECEHDDTLDEMKDDDEALEYFRDEIKSISDLIYIHQQDYYSELSSDTKYFIQAGNQVLSILQENSKICFNDYSPFLLDFLKSLEVEIKELYLNYFNDIYANARQILEDINYKIQLNIESDSTIREELNYLKNLSEQIKKFRKNFSPSGIKPLYYLIKHFAFNNNLKFVENYNGFISQAYDSFLIKNNNLISRLKNMGELRNKTIHSNLIGSKEEFLMNYYDIVITLQLIVTLKKFNS